jgi:hypothetical protein
MILETGFFVLRLHLLSLPMDCSLYRGSELVFGLDSCGYCSYKIMILFLGWTSIFLA